MRPSASPKTTPPITPSRNPSSASSRVTQTWFQSGPSGVPTVAHFQITRPMSEGLPKKNGSITLVRESSSQLPSIPTPKAMRSAITSRRCWRTFFFAAATFASSARLDMLLRPLVAHEDLVAEVLPDVAVEIDEARLEADLRNVTRARQVHLVDAFDRPGAGSDHAYPVGERDRLFEVVRDEDDRGGGRRPEVEQLVLHQRARLDVKSAERLVHQDDLGRRDQALCERGALAHAA